MRVIFLLIFVFSCCIYGQELLKDEYEIYGQELANGEYKNYQFQLGIPAKYQKSLLILFENDSMTKKIVRLPIKKLDSEKLTLSIHGKELQHKEFKRLKIDNTEKVYCSPIFFESDNTGYFFQIIESENLPKPVFLFLKAQKIEEKWLIQNYYDIL